MPPTRRAILQALPLLGAGLTGGSLGCGDNEGGDAGDAAAAVLEPDESSFLVAVWSRVGARQAVIELRTAGALMRELAIGLVDGLGVADVGGLTPATRYEVTVVVGGLALGPHRVRTAPAADDPRPVRLAVVADVDPSPAFASGMLDALVAEEPELAIAIGDFPYTDNGPPAMTVAAYRARHAELRTHPPVRRLLEACGLRAIYDDHEFRNDWDAHFVAAEPARYAAAMQVWDEFFPLRTAGEVRYRRWRWGAHLECFLLDCRRFRSANAAPDGAGKTMLGAAQRAWLLDGVTRSTATFKLILTSVPLGYGLGDDHWSAFAIERDAVLAALIGTPGVAFVSGDQHWFAAQRHAFGVREFQVGPIARGLGVPGPAPAGVLFRAERYNAGLIDVAGDQLTVTGLGDDGEPFYRQTLSAAELTPRAG